MKARIVKTVVALLAGRTRPLRRRRPLSTTALGATFVLALALSVTGAALLGSSARGQEAASGEPAPPAIADQTAETPEEASRLARKLGKRVEITSQRHEDASGYANPDGTRSTRLFSGPVRTREDGEWRAIDPSLKTEPGALAPKASVGDLTFSDGGSGTVARLAEAGKSVSLGLDSTLPRPDVSGNEASYKDVFGNDDLKLEALPEGFSERVVIEDRPAQAPVYRFKLHASDGLHAEVASGERLRLRDADGKTVALSPPARMWGAEKDPQTGEPTRSAPLDIDVRDSSDGQVLELRPDQGFLSDPAVKLPITVDPTFTIGTIDRDTYVMSGYPNDSSGQGPSGNLEVGWRAGHQKTRSYIDFHTEYLAGLADKNLLKGRLRVYQSDNYSCTATTFEAYRPTEVWYNPSTSWNNQPAVTSTVQGTLDTNKGGGSACPAGSLNMTINKFLIQGWIDGTYPHYGLMLRAGGDEALPSTRKTFAASNHPSLPQPYLDVDYNSWPDTPVLSSPADKSTVNTSSPTLSGRFSDADGGTGYVKYEVYRADDLTTPVAVGHGPTVASGEQSPWRVTAGALKDDTRYVWRAIGIDGVNASKSWSGYWSFTTDLPTSSDDAGILPHWQFEEEGLTDRLSLGTNVGNGNLVAKARELKLAGTGLDLELERYYNSKASARGGAFGPGWTLSTGQDVRLERRSTDGVVRFFGPSGYMVRFTEPMSNSDGTTTYKTPRGVEADLKRKSDNSYELKLDKTREKYVFSSSGRLDRQVSKNDQTISYAYDTGGRLTEITDTQGRKVVLAYDSATGYLAQISDRSDPNSPRNWDYAYESGRLRSSTDPTGAKVSYEYDAGGRLAAIVDAKGVRTELANDSLGRVTEIRRAPGQPEASTTRYAWSPTTSACDGTKDKNGNAVSTSARQSTDPNGHRTTYCADEHDQILRVEDALGHRQEKSYTAEGNVSTATNATSDAANSDFQGRDLQKKTSAAGSVTSFKYNASSEHLPASIGDPQGNTLAYKYDSAGNMQSTAAYKGDPNDPNTNPQQETEIKLDYNGESAGDRDCTTQTTDTGPKGTLRCSKDGEGHETVYRYDAKGNLTEEDPPGDGPEAGGTAQGKTRYEYDAKSRVVAVTDPNGKRREIAYDALDRQTRILFRGDDSEVRYSYDENGNKVKREEGKSGLTGALDRTTDYTYDRLNRLVKERFPDGKTNEYSHDPADNLSELRDETGTTRYDYNEVNLPVQMTEPCAAPAGLCQPGQIGPQTQFSYDSNNNRKETRFPNGVVQAARFDKDERAQEIKGFAPGQLSAGQDPFASGAPTPQLSNLAYDYQDASLNKMTDLRQKLTDRRLDFKTDYDYDGVNRLKAANTDKTGDGSTVDHYSYAYDKAST